jgi:hypothetical protein
MIAVEIHLKIDNYVIRFKDFISRYQINLFCHYDVEDMHNTVG